MCAKCPIIKVKIRVVIFFSNGPHVEERLRRINESNQRALPVTGMIFHQNFRAIWDRFCENPRSSLKFGTILCRMSYISLPLTPERRQQMNFRFRQLVLNRPVAIVFTIENRNDRVAKSSERPCYSNSAQLESRYVTHTI